ncbi:sensor histidine kinase [Streptosporangium sandarakinum]|uniref:sensor histidine kinase n=1 Tax=Streptosporangium sandarakinum TaxID=1260955 RepID=UPI0036B84293
MRVPRGLRTRLVVGFVLVTALGALTTAALTFGQARSAILERVQSSAVHDLRTQIDSLALDLPSDPDQADLRALTLQLDRAGGSRGWRTAASLHDGPLVVAASAAPALPAQLRSATATATTALVQRFQRDGRPWLAIAVPVRDAARPAARPPLVVFASFSLAAQQRDVDSLVTAARAGALPVALAATLQRDTAVLRDMEARARRFAADVSHELRTPLAAMTAVTGLLDEDVAAGRMPPETAEAVGLVADETRRLARLVDDLMEVSRFDAGAAVLTLDEVDLAQLVRKTLALRHWQDRVPVDIPDGLRIRLDPRRVDVILANLVGNALRHGGPAPTVQLWARAVPGGVALTVTDDGPGIAADLLPYVFDRFTKGDAARARSEGSGLGLAIAYENARLHGGTLSAANAPDGGAVFTLTLPWNRP